MPLSKKFKADVLAASYEELLEMQKEKRPYWSREKQDFFDQVIDVARQRATGAHRKRTEQHMTYTEGYGRWQLVLGFSWLGIQLIPVGGALAVGLAIGAALG